MERAAGAEELTGLVGRGLADMGGAYAEEADCGRRITGDVESVQGEACGGRRTRRIWEEKERESCVSTEDITKR